MAKKSKNPRPRTIIIIALIFGLLLCFGNLLQILPEQFALNSIKVSTPDSYEYKTFDEILHKYVQFGLLDYQKLKADPALKLAIDELASTSPAKLTGRMEQLSFWINAYNLGVIKNISELYPDKTRRRRNLAHVIVGGKIYTLAQIKDEMLAEQILQVNWKAIFLLCNGDMSAPRIAAHAYRPGTLNEDAEKAYKRFVLNRLNFRIDEKTKTFFVSPFYLWNNKYFLHEFATVFEMVNDALPKERQVDLNAVNKSFLLSYDQRINDLAYYNQAKKEFEEQIRAEQDLDAELSRQTQEALKQQIKNLDMRDVPAH